MLELDGRLFVKLAATATTSNDERELLKGGGGTLLITLQPRVRQKGRIVFNGEIVFRPIRGSFLAIRPISVRNITPTPTTTPTTTVAENGRCRLRT